MAFTPGRTYRIRNKASDNLVITPKNWSSDETQLQIYPLQGKDDGNRIRQIWHVMPLDDGVVVLVNKQTGLCINVHNDSTDATRGVQQFPVRSPESGAAQGWILKPAPDGYYTMVNRKSGLELTPQNWGTTASTNLQQNSPGAPDMRDRQYWALDVEDDYTQISGLKPVDKEPNEIGEVVRMTGFAQPAQNTTPQVLVGQVSMPFFAIGDETTPQEQLGSSPYYILKRYGYWERQYFYEHGGSSAVTERKKITFGLTTSTAKTVETTTGISVTAAASFGFGGFSASLSTTLSHELKVTTHSGVVEQSSREEEIVRKYKGDGVRIAECLWYRGDRYTVERMDGTRILEWKTLDPKVSVLDSYPPR